MTNIKRGFVFAVFFAAAVFASGGNRPAGDVALEEISIIGGPEADLLFLWTSVAVDRDENVYFSDALEYSIKKFGPGGEMLKKTGCRGSGPGAFEKAAGMAVIGDFVYAWDLYAPALQVFDRDLVYQKTITMPGNVDALAGLAGGRIAAAVRPSYDRPMIVILTPEGKTIREFSLVDPGKPAPAGTISLAAGPSEEFYVGYLFRDLVEKRGPEGERLWARAPMTKDPPPVAEAQDLKLPSETCILNLARDSRGRIYVLGGTKAEHQGRDVFIFEADGSTVGVLVLPEPSYSVYFDHRDFLYVSADGGVTMKKYRVIFK
ncbi:MAG: NHL repeat-containing protein [Candidatus Aminicenantales bacterium]